MGLTKASPDSIICAYGNAVIGQVKKMSIPDQPLGEALTQIGQQAHVNILFAPASVQGLRAPALHGQMNTQQALNELLRGTRLAAIPDGSGFLVAPDPAKTVERIATARDTPATKII